MHTTETEIPIRPLSEIFPHLEFRINTDTSIVYACTKCNTEFDRFWSFFIGRISGKHRASAFLRVFTNPCPNPEDYESGQKLIEALHGHESWHKFMEKVLEEDRYTGKLEFWLEYSPEKAMCKHSAYPNSSTGNVVAIVKPNMVEEWFNTYDCYTAGHGVGPNAEQIHNVLIGEKMLHQRCVKITEKEARLIHPNLFEYLKKIDTFQR